MTTALDIVSDALLACGSHGTVDNVSSEDSQFALRTLNRMLDSWGNERSMLYQIADDTFTMTANDSTYSSTNLASGIRPASIDSCFVRLDSTDYNVEVIDNRTFNMQSYKPVTGTPRIVYCAPLAASWDFTFYPTPDAAYVVHMQVRRLLTSSALTLATTFSGPPGYEMALVDNLAVLLAPRFGRPVSGDLRQSARQARAVLQQANYQQLIMDSPLSNGPKHSIYEG